MGIESYGTVDLRKISHPVQNSDLLFQIYMTDYMVKFLAPDFSHNFTKNNRRDLKMGYIDTPRRQLQSVLKIRV